jgi:protein phosphatase 2C family protein 2/3
MSGAGTPNSSSAASSGGSVPPPPPLALGVSNKFIPQVSVNENVVCATVQGNRDYQEDSFSFLKINDNSEETSLKPIALYGVYDGHGGSEASTFCRTHLLSTIMESLNDFSSLDTIKDGVVRGFIETEKYFKIPPTPFGYSPVSGACLLVAIVFKNFLVLASAGDVRSLLVYADGTHEQVSVEHPATLAEETERIHAAGLHISAGRVNGSLAVARSLGDFNLKVGIWAEDFHGILNDPHKHAVTCVPQITVIHPKKKPHMLLLMSDGVGEGPGMTSDFIAESSKTVPPEELAKFIVQTSLDRGSQDNITCMTIPLGSLNCDPPTPLAIGKMSGCVQEVFHEDGGDMTPSLLGYASGGYTGLDEDGMPTLKTYAESIDLEAVD